jgi:hypothetical protein
LAQDSVDAHLPGALVFAVLSPLQGEAEAKAAVHVVKNRKFNEGSSRRVAENLRDHMLLASSSDSQTQQHEDKEEYSELREIGAVCRLTANDQSCDADSNCIIIPSLATHRDEGRYTLSVFASTNFTLKRLD